MGGWTGTPKPGSLGCASGSTYAFFYLYVWAGGPGLLNLDRSGAPLGVPSEYSNMLILQG